jgi:hypothetical protein
MCKFDKREGNNTRNAPAYRIIPLNLAQSTCETSQNAQYTSRLQAFSRSRLSRLSKVDCIWLFSASSGWNASLNLFPGRDNGVIRSYAHRLAPMAAELMGCKAVRLYQDCAFLKASTLGLSRFTDSIPILAANEWAGSRESAQQ